MSLELELQAAVSYMTCILGIKFRSSIRVIIFSYQLSHLSNPTKWSFNHAKKKNKSNTSNKQWHRINILVILVPMVRNGGTARKRLNKSKNKSKNDKLQILQLHV